MPQVPRELWLAVFGALFLLGIAATAERVLRARRHGYSVRLQIFVPLAATTLALSALFAAIVIDSMQSRAELLARRAAEDEARVVTALLRRSLEHPGGDLVQAARELEASGVLQAFSRGVADTEVRVLDGAGRTLVDVGQVRESPLLPARVGRTVVEAQVPVAPPPGSAAAVASPGSVRVRKGTFGMLQLLSDVAPKVALLALLFSVVSAVMAGLIGGAVAIPIERLTRAAERVAAGERQAALPEPRGREVRLLTRALESMRRELEQRHALESFVADLSHELKNPIASVRAAAEVLEEGAADDPTTARRFAARISESAGKLQALTADLLSLARLEARGLESTREPVELRALLQQCIESQHPQAVAAGVQVDLHAPHELRTRGDVLWLRRAVENLVANALQHSPRGARVTVTLDEQGSRALVRVADQGPGIEPSVRERLFTRFVTTRHGQGGTGLGLAIVRAVAEQHGGQARLVEMGLTGATFELVLPRA